jgi:hypothetical protein
MLSKLIAEFEKEGIKVSGKDRLLGALEGHTEWKDLFLGYVRSRRRYGIVFTPGDGVQDPAKVVEKAMKTHGFSEQNIRAFCANASIN